MINDTEETIHQMSVTETRQNLLPLLKQVNSMHTRVIVENHKKPVAVILSYREYKKLTK